MKKILVVDDGPVDRLLAGKLLERHPEWTVAYANNGREGLACVEQDVPDLVLTDLQMPEMNGLELVEELRRKHPFVPVILMTAHGSEDIAIQALQKGASSYVPKHNLAQDLVDTVRSVLSVATAERGHQRLLECLMRTESQFLLDNDPSLIPPLIGHLRDNLMRMNLCDESGLIRVTIALSEALTEAIHQGNLELSWEMREEDEERYQQLAHKRRSQQPYRDRRVHVLAKELLHEARYIIRHEGPPLDLSDLPDPGDPGALEKRSNRGMMLIRTFMDEVNYNETGTEITMVKRRDR